MHSQRGTSELKKQNKMTHRNFFPITSGGMESRRQTDKQKVSRHLAFFCGSTVALDGLFSGGQAKKVTLENPS